MCPTNSEKVEIVADPSSSSRISSAFARITAVFAEANLSRAERETVLRAVGAVDNLTVVRTPSMVPGALLRQQPAQGTHVPRQAAPALPGSKPDRKVKAKSPPPVRPLTDPVRALYGTDSKLKGLEEALAAAQAVAAEARGPDNNVVEASVKEAVRLARQAVKERKKALRDQLEAESSNKDSKKETQ